MTDLLEHGELVAAVERSLEDEVLTALPLHLRVLAKMDRVAQQFGEDYALRDAFATVVDRFLLFPAGTKQREMLRDVLADVAADTQLSVAHDPALRRAIAYFNAEYVKPIKPAKEEPVGGDVDAAAAVRRVGRPRTQRRS